MIRVLSTVNLEPIKTFFRGEPISFAGYNQSDRELLDTSSPAYAPDVEQMLFFIDGEEFLRNRMFHVPDDALAASVLDDLQLLLSRLSAFTGAKPATICTINTIALPPRTFLTHLNVNSKYSFTALEHAMNESIQAFAANRANCLVLDWRGLVSERGYSNLMDDKFWYLARVKLNQLALSTLASEYKHLSQAFHAGPRKVLVLDLDNTLWGGVLGELGIAGIQLGEDGTGKAYRDFQLAIRSLRETGALLALASKNNEPEVLEAFRAHSMMALQLEDFACIRVNWTAKPDNILEISRNLNLGLDSMVFLDDNAMERDLVRSSLPEVAVPEFPSEAVDLKRWFLSEVIPQYFGKVRLTEEDRNKTQQYQANTGRAEAASQMSLDEYLRTLDIQTTIYEKPRLHRERIAQLIQKTNQFNLTTRRHSEADISQMYEDPSWIVLAMEYADRFGQEGVVAAALVHIEESTANIDSFVMSCRVIGRRVEYVLLAQIVEEARLRGANRVIGEYIRTAKNAVSGDFYLNGGFNPESDSLFALDISAENTRQVQYAPEAELSSQ